MPISRPGYQFAEREVDFKAPKNGAGDVPLRNLSILRPWKGFGFYEKADGFDRALLEP